MTWEEGSVLEASRRVVLVQPRNFSPRAVARAGSNSLSGRALRSSPFEHSLRSEIMKCTHCAATIHQGQNATQITEGVQGVEDFVSLDQPLTFCSIQCLHEFFSEEKRPVYRLQRKVP